MFLVWVNLWLKRVNCMNDFNKEFINNVKLFHSNKDEDYFEEKYSFIKYVVSNLDSVSDDYIEICSEEYEGLNCDVDACYYEEDSNTYNLYIAIYDDNVNENDFLTQEEVEGYYAKIYNFIDKAISYRFADFPESSFTYQIANDIHSNLKNSKIVANIISNYHIPDSYKKDKVVQIDDYNVSFRTYDFKDLKTMLESSLNETSTLDCVDTFGKEIDALLLSSNDDFDVYVFGMKGTWLASLYKVDSVRLLEPNVRSYLKRTSKVNSGILDTVKNCPEEFVSFNNGISAVATNISSSTNSGINYKIKNLTNFQIVNGGQTTATLYECSKDKLEEELKQVIVPVKLTVVKNIVNSSTFIRDISLYSNTQTAIKKSDPPSNLPFYIEIKRLSSECLSSDGENNYVCYFERTNGEYQTELKRNNGSKKFTKTNPKNRKFDKIDLARAINCWEQFPYVTSQGKEKCFLYFNNIIKNQLINPDEAYFKNAYATIMLYKKLGVISKKMGLTVKSNVVAYTLSLISLLYDKSLNLNEIWEKKEVPDDLVKLSMELMPKVHQAIIDAPNSCPEPRMWARKKECWEKVKEITVDYIPNKNNRIDFYYKNDALSYISIPENFNNPLTWTKLLLWNEKYRLFTKRQVSMLKMASKYVGLKPLTKKQIDYANDLFIMAVKNGYVYEDRG